MIILFISLQNRFIYIKFACYQITQTYPKNHFYSAKDSPEIFKAGKKMKAIRTMFPSELKTDTIKPLNPPQA